MRTVFLWLQGGGGGGGGGGSDIAYTTRLPVEERKLG